MSSENIIKRYPLDLTGKHPDNKISDELHVVDSRTRVFTLKAGAFYTDSVKITYLGDPLIPNEHFTFVRLVETAVKRSRKNVAMFVLITAEVRGEVHIEYQCVGGEFQEIPESLIEMLDSYKHDARGIYYEDLIDKPTLFEPVRHLHSIHDIHGLDPIADPLNQLVAIQRERAAKADSILVMKLHQIEEKIKDVDFSKISEANIDALRVEVTKAKEIADAIGDPSENRAEEERFRHGVNEKLKAAQTALDNHKASLTKLGEKDIELTNTLDTAKTDLSNRINETKNALDAHSQLVASYKNSERKLVSDIPGATLANNDTMGFTLTVPRDPKIAEHDTAIGTLNTNLEKVRNLPRATPDDVTTLRQAQDTLKGRVGGQDTKLTEHGTRLQDHDTRINAVRGQADATADNLNQFETKVDSHFAELEKGLKTLNTDITNEKSARENAVTDLQGKLDTTNQTVAANKQAIENSLNEAKQSLGQSINEAKQTAQTNLDNAKQALNDKIDKEKAALQGNIDTTNNNLTALQGEVSEWRESSSGTTDGLKNKLDETKNSLEAYKTSNDAAVDVERKRIDALSSDVNSYKTSNDEKVNTIKTKGEQTATQLNALSADITPRMNSAESRLAGVEAKENANAAADAARDATINQLKGKDTELAAKDAELEGSIQAVKSDLETAKTNLDREIGTAKQEAQAANQALASTVSANKEAVDTQLTELTQKANALQTALDKTNETLGSNNSNATDGISAVDARVDELKQKSEAKDNELTNTLSALETKVTNHINENATKEDSQDKEIEALKAKTTATDSALTTAKSDLAGKIEALKNNVNSSTTAINSEITALKEKDNTLTSSIQMTNATLNEAKQMLHTRDTALESGLNAEVTRAKAKENEIEAKITQANADRVGEKRALESSINELKEKQASDKSAVEEKIAQANQTHTTLQEVVNANKGKLSALEGDIAAVREITTTNGNNITAHTGRLTALENKGTELEKSIQTEHDKNATQDEKITVLETAKEDYKTRIEALETLKNEVNTRMTEQNGRFNLYATKEEVNSRVSTLERSISETRNQLTATIETGNHTTLSSAKSYTDEKFRTASSSIDAASQSITSKYNELKGLVDEQSTTVTAANSQIGTLSNKVTEQGTTIGTLTSRIQTQEGKTTDLTGKVKANTDKNIVQDTKISILESKLSVVSTTLDSIKAVSGNVDALTAKLTDVTATKTKAEANAGNITALQSSVASLRNDCILKSTRYMGNMVDNNRPSEENTRVLGMGKQGANWVAMMPSEVNFHKHTNPKVRIAGFKVDQNNGTIDFDIGEGIKAKEVALRENYWGYRTMRDIIDAMRDHLLIERGGHNLPEMSYAEVDKRFDKIWPALRNGLPTPNSKEIDLRIIRNPTKPELDYYQGYQIDAILLGKIRQLLFYPSLDTGINYLNYGVMKIVNRVVQGWQSAAGWTELASNRLIDITIPASDKEIKLKHGRSPNSKLWISKEPISIIKPGLYELSVTLSERELPADIHDIFGLYSKNGTNMNRWFGKHSRIQQIPAAVVGTSEHRYYRHKFTLQINESDLNHAPLYLLIDFSKLNARINVEIIFSHLCLTDWRGPFLNTYIQGEKDYAEPVDKVSTKEAELIQAEVRRYVREQSQPQTNTLDISRFRVQPGAEDWSNVSAGENNTINVRGVVLQQFDGGETSVFAPSQVFQISEPQTWTVPATLVGKKAEIIVRAASKQDGNQIIHSAVRRTFVTLPNAQISILAGELTSFGTYLTVNVSQSYPDSLYPRIQVPASDVNQKQTAMITITV